MKKQTYDRNVYGDGMSSVHAQIRIRIDRPPWFAKKRDHQKLRAAMPYTKTDRCSAIPPSALFSSISMSCCAATFTDMKRAGSYSFFPRQSASMLGSLTRMSSKHSVCSPYTHGCATQHATQHHQCTCLSLFFQIPSACHVHPEKKNE